MIACANIPTDGVSVVGKLARLLSLPSQLSHTQGIHLAMVEFLYTNEVPANTSKIVAATPQSVPEERAEEEDWEDEESYCEELKNKIEVQDAILPQYDAKADDLFLFYQDVLSARETKG
jgi:hypothetical protein